MQEKNGYYREQKYAMFSPLVLRISLGIVFVLFGVDKLVNPSLWRGWFPSWIQNVVDVDIFLQFQGVLEILIGGLLLGGLFTRMVAGVASVLLFLIIVTIGINDITIRNMGLLGASLSLIFLGGGELSVDRFLRKL